MSRRSAEDIYNDALDLPPEDRPAFVAAACAQDAGLRREIEELLEIAGQWPELLDPVWAEEAPRPEQLGKYRILEEIGRGAMGRVFLAENRNLPELRVAIKILPEHLADPRGIERLHREAVILARLDHPRIARIHDIDEDGGFHYIAMQFVAGETLAERLRRGPLTVPETVKIGIQIADALGAAHGRGVIHRDLKPLNVMIAVNGDVKVLDFGIAKVKELPFGPGEPGTLEPGATESATLEPGSTEPGSTEPGSTEPGAWATASSTFRGTIDYMSPEQLACQEIDVRTDLWGLGCILFECLTGRQALRRGGAETGPGLIQPDWGFLPRNTPPQLAGLLRRCLAIEREDRPASAEEVRAQLEEVSRRRGAGSRRRVYLLAGVLTVTAAAVMGLGGLWGPGGLLGLGGRLDTGGPLGLGGFLARPGDAGAPSVPGASGTAGAFSEAVFDAEGPRIVLRAFDRDHRVIWSRWQIGGVPVAAGNRLLRDGRVPAVLPVSADSAIIAVCARGPIGHDSIHGVHAQSGEVLWSRGPQAALPAEPREGRWSCAWQEVYDLGDGEEPLFLICWREGSYAPSALEFARADGSVEAIYYHPGHIYLWTVWDNDADGKNELLFYGYNNGLLRRLDAMSREAVERSLTPAVVFVLDGPTAGQAYPPTMWPGVGRAPERRYFAIPPHNSQDAPDYDSISCGADMRLLISLKDQRRLQFTAAFEPSHFTMTQWSEEWIRMRGPDVRLPVYDVRRSELLRTDVPVNP